MKTLIKFFCAGALAFSASAFADVNTAVPLRVGPVQYYGALGTDGGKVISQASKKEAVLRGVSLYWSDATGLQYYNPEVITWAAKTLGIDVFRFAMGIGYYDSDGGTNDSLDANYSFKYSPSTYYTKIDQMVEAAIKNDVYIIIDWHSHRAHLETDLASEFFATISQKYKNIPNVIYEIYNEPVSGSGGNWDAVKSYANTISPKIRANTQNLILVGTPIWSQLTDYGGVNATNVAYVFHFYAGSHFVSTYGSRITKAKSSGNAVFISEWGTTEASGKGDVNTSSTNEWLTFMDQNNISNCNWSLRQYTSSVDASNEGSAIFGGDKALITQNALDNATYTTSGTLVKSYLQKHIRNFADSLVAGKTSGSCHFASKTVSETSGSVSLSNGCTYTSSNEAAVVVSGATATIVGAGFSILTGNDGSQSVIVVESEPKQNSGITDFTCRYGGVCTQGHKMTNYSGISDFETLLTTTLTTAEGGALTITSLTPNILTVKTATCNNSSYCYGATKGQTLPMAQFTGIYGDGKILVTAPAVSGYRKLNDTVTVTFAKGQQRIYSKFKNRTLALEAISEANALPDTMMFDQIPTTYTYNGQTTTPYLTKVGNTIQAGTQNALVRITVNAPETDHYEAYEQSITVIVGDSSLAVNKDEYIESPIIATAKIAPFNAQIQNTSLLLQVPQSGLVSWAIYTPAGKIIATQKQNLSAGSHLIPLEYLPAGSYLMRVRQKDAQSTFHWNKR